jgi:ribokinase
MDTPRVLVVGSANLDYVIRVDAAPAPGETVIGEGFALYPGGKGANQALACSMAGCPTSFLGKLGTEPESEVLTKSLDEAGVDLAPVIRSDEPTGRAFIVVDQSGENRIVVASGANATLTPEELEERWLADRPPDAVLLQLEIPLGTVTKALDLARGCNAVTVLNPAPSRGPLPESLLAQVDYLVPNRTEAAAMLEQSINERSWVAGAPRRLAARVRRGAVLTLGAAGAMAATKDCEVWQEAPTVEAVDTTAAGDTFCGYLTAGLVQGIDLREAVRQAVYAASLACTRPGAQSSVPGREEVEEVMASERRRRV